MKNRFLAVALLAVLPGWSAHAELLYETFDSHAPGTLMQNVPGWSTLEGLSAANGVVSTQRVTSTPNALELPKPPGTPFATKTTAAYTNFSYTYRGTNGFILRSAATLFRTNSKQLITMELGKGTDTIIQVAFRTNRQIVVGNYTTAVLSVTGRYADVELYYDMSNNLASLDYDGTNVMPWRAIGTPVSTQFSLVAFKRLTSAAGTEGTVLIDNAAVEVIPPTTMGWWRFESDPPSIWGDWAGPVEHSGRFEPQHRMPGDYVSGSWTWLWTREGPVHNHHAYSRPQFAFWQTRDILNLGNWTTEAILKIEPGSSLFCLFDWEDADPMNCLIRIFWDNSSSNLTCTLREDGRGDTQSSHYSALGIVPADGQWHHVAIRKFQTTLNSYVDYDLKSGTTLSAYADGSYAFRTNTQFAVYLGMTRLGGSPTGSGVAFDEVRFSSEALDADQFLQIPAAEFTGLPTNPADATWTFDVQTRPPILYHLERCTNLSVATPVWVEVANWQASNFVSSVSCPKPPYRAAAFRVRK